MGIVDDFSKKTATGWQAPSLQEVMDEGYAGDADLVNRFPTSQGYPDSRYIEGATPTQQEWEAAYEYELSQFSITDWLDEDGDWHGGTPIDLRQMFITDVTASAHADAAIREEKVRLDQEEIDAEERKKESEQSWISSVADGSDDRHLMEYLEGADRRERHGIQLALNRNAIIRELLSRGGEFDYISDLSSAYIKMPSGLVLRVSDHELPSTPEREHNRSMGLHGRWDADLTSDARTQEEAMQDALQTLDDLENDL